MSKLNYFDANTCGSESNVTTITCSVVYSGNKSPVIGWRRTRNGTTIEGEDFTENTFTALPTPANYSSNVFVIKSDLAIETNAIFTGDAFICEATTTSSQSKSCKEPTPVVLERVNIADIRKISCQTPTFFVESKSLICFTVQT